MATQRHAASEMDFATRRMRRRLRQDLGVNLAGVEIILQMRAQVQGLQMRVRELESELASPSDVARALRSIATIISKQPGLK